MWNVECGMINDTDETTAVHIQFNSILYCSDNNTHNINETQEISTTSPYEANYLLFGQTIQNIQFNCTNGKKKTDNDISVANIRINKLSSSVKHAEREELNLSVLTINTPRDGWCQKNCDLNKRLQAPQLESDYGKCGTHE